MKTAARKRGSAPMSNDQWLKHRERQERERIAQQAEARARQEAWKREQAAPTLCFGCDQLFKREHVTPAVWGLFVCAECARVARKGAATTKVAQTSISKTGRVGTAYKAFAAFAQVAHLSGKPLRYGPEAK